MLHYIQNTQVKTDFVTDPVDWKYSSARNYAEDQTIFKIDVDNMNLGML